MREGFWPDGDGCVADGVGKGAGFRSRFDAEFVGEGGLAALELAKGVFAPPGGGEGAHQRPVGRFVCGVGLEDALDRRDGVERSTGRALQFGVVEGSISPDAAQMLPPGDGPVEVGLVGEEIAAVERQRGREMLSSVPAGRGGKL